MPLNLTSYQLNAASVTARNAEYTGDPLDDGDGDGSYADPYLGMNRAGSNAPGIGIATQVIDPKLEDWSILDQAEDPRTPQDSQHLGGDGLGAGDETVNPLNVILDPFGTPDFNDTLSYIAAVVQAAPGAGYNTADADPINRSNRTIEIGERLWGTNTVA